MVAHGFRVLQREGHSRARVGELWTAHGGVQTPAFMPVGSQATVKGLSSDDLTGLGFEMVLCNAYHLYLRPGHQ
ncbi:MAG: tRNA-guanine transglycosylase, partial [Nitrospirae bacterium]